MERKLTWDDADELGAALRIAYPDVHPLEVDQHDLRHLVWEMLVFDPRTSPCDADVASVEAVRTVWYANFTAGSSE